MQQELEALLEDLRWKESLYSEGLLALPTINQAKETISSKQTEIDAANTAISEGKARAAALSAIDIAQRFAKEIQIAQDVIETLLLEKKRLHIRAPKQGKVLSILKKVGENAPKSVALFWVEENREEENVIYAYLQSSRDQTVRKGMLGFANLNNVDVKKYGQMLVRVEKVWSFPVSTKEILRIVGNSNLVSFLLKGSQESPIQVVLRPVKDLRTISGYAWTSEKGPPFRIATGTVGKITIRTEARRPIEYIFPLFREAAESVEENP